MIRKNLLSNKYWERNRLYMVKRKEDKFIQINKIWFYKRILLEDFYFLHHIHRLNSLFLKCRFHKDINKKHILTQLCTYDYSKCHNHNLSNKL